MTSDKHSCIMPIQVEGKARPSGPAMTHLPQHVESVQIVEPIVSISECQNKWIIQILLCLNGILKVVLSRSCFPGRSFSFISLTPLEIVINLPLIILLGSILCGLLPDGVDGSLNAGL